jgi:transposase
METKIKMDRKALKQAHVLRNYNEGALSRKEAAEKLGLSERQVSRKAKELKEKGEAALIHKNTGRAPIHTLNAEMTEQILALRREATYEGCNISHFRDILAVKEISISYDALYRLLNREGIKSPMKHRKATKVHRRRKRKANAGALLQIDATPYEWFGGETKYALHGAIDDAMGELTGLYMTGNECLSGYFEVMRQTCLAYGVPLSVYSDKHTIFRSPKTAEKEERGEEANLTQFGRALAELGTEIIHAHSPQAKGRIERVWVTLQSRLPVELRMRNIQTLEDANAFLQNEYLRMFNEKFAVPAMGESIFVSCQHSEDIDRILCVKETRKMDNAGSFSYKGHNFKVLDEGYPLIPAKASVTLLISTRDALRVEYKGRVYHTCAFEKPNKPESARKAKTSIAQKQVEPHLKHGSDEWKKIWHAEDYQETLAFLYDIFFKNDSQFT